MPRVLVVGQPGNGGPLPCSRFAESLARRLGLPRLRLVQRTEPVEEPNWIAAEEAGTFSEPLFREADTVVWLHFSPLPYLRDWFGRGLDAVTALATGHGRETARAGWNDVLTAFHYLMIAPDMYSLFGHAALAHVKVIELRTPRQAQFWLLAQRPRRQS